MHLFRLRRDFFIFLIFLILSGLFWLSTALNGYYDYEVDVPVVVSNVPTNLVQTSEDLEALRVTIHDKGFALLQYVRGHKVSPLQINFSAYQNQEKRCVISSTELHKLITKKFPNSTTINSIKPDKIELSYVEGVGKSVPVRLVGNIEPARSYYLEHVEIQPKMVTIYAPKSKIDSIRFVVTENMQIKDFSDTVKSRIKIKQEPSTKAVPREVMVTLFPDILTEEELEVPITVVNVPEGTILRTFPSRVKVKFTVGASLYRSISASQFEVVADYEDISPNDEKCCISLMQTPNGVKAASLSVDEVDYLIEN